MKTNVVAVLSLLFCLSAANAAKLNPVLEDNFEDGNLNNPVWQPIGTTGNWSAQSENTIRPNKVLWFDGTTNGSTGDISISFPTYTYDPNNPIATTNPDGPDWRLSFRCTVGWGINAANGTNGIWVMYLGTDNEPSEYILEGALDPATMAWKYQFRGLDGIGEYWWPGELDADYGVRDLRWFQITLQWEGSTNTLTGTAYQYDTGQSLSASWQPSDQFNSINRLRIGIERVDRYYFDDIKLEVAQNPSDCAQLIANGDNLSADLNGDCSIDLKDLAVLAGTWTQCNEATDPQCAPVASSITVDADVPAGQTGDLEKMRNYYRGSSEAFGIDSDMQFRLDALNFDKIKVGALGGDQGTIDGGGQFVPYAGNIITRMVETANTTGYALYTVVRNPKESFMNYSGGVYWGIADVAGYKTYCKAILQYLLDNLNADTFTLEVGNETDIGGESWLVQNGSSLPYGSSTMYNAYFNWYLIWVDIVNQVESANPGKTVRLAGPVVTPYTFPGMIGGDFDWAQKFCQDIHNNSSRLDLFTWHFYGLNAGVGDRSHPFGQFTALEQNVKDAISNNGLSAPVAITEWGPSYNVDAGQEGANSIINGNNIGAAWTCAFLEDALATDVDEAFLLTVRDGFHDSYGQNFIDHWGWPSFLAEAGGYYVAKPIYNVCSMLQKMPGEKVSVTSNAGADVDVIASADSASAAVLAYNYNWTQTTDTDISQTVPVEVHLTNLPFASQKATVLHYLVDETHSNGAHYIQADPTLSIDAAHCELEMVDHYEVTIDANGDADLNYFEMGPSAVSLWLITTETNSFDDVVVGYANGAVDAIHPDNAGESLFGDPNVVLISTSRPDGSAVLGYQNGKLVVVNNDLTSQTLSWSRPSSVTALASRSDGSVIVGFANGSVDLLSADLSTGSNIGGQGGMSVTAIAVRSDDSFIYGTSVGSVNAVSADLVISYNIWSRGQVLNVLAARSDDSVLVGYNGGSVDIISALNVGSSVGGQGGMNVKVIAVRSDDSFIYGTSVGQVSAVSADLATISYNIWSRGWAVNVMAARSDGSVVVGYDGGSVDLISASNTGSSIGGWGGAAPVIKAIAVRSDDSFLVSNNGIIDAYAADLTRTVKIWDRGFIINTMSIMRVTPPATCAVAGTTNTAGDINGDCYVNINDLTQMAADWLTCTTPGQAGCLQTY